MTRQVTGTPADDSLSSPAVFVWPPGARARACESTAGACSRASCRGMRERARTLRTPPHEALSTTKRYSAGTRETCRDVRCSHCV